MKLCEYGCNQPATHQFKNGKWCCNKLVNYCPSWSKNMGISKIGNKLSKSHKEKIKKTMKQQHIRNKIKESNLGDKNPNWKGGYDKNNIPRYDVYADKLSYAEEIRRNKEDQNILEIKCAYCGKWFIPKSSFINYRITCLNNLYRGDGRLYCSDKCKLECPIFNKTEWPEGFKEYNNFNSSREVQPQLRQLRFKIDNYICQNCHKHQNELDVALHCHHLEGIRWEPLESADIDKVITYCKNCHLEVHKKDGCGYNDMKCKKEVENEMVI